MLTTTAVARSLKGLRRAKNSTKRKKKKMMNLTTIITWISTPPVARESTAISR